MGEKTAPALPAQFPTPDNAPTERVCRVFRVPNDDAWLGALMAAAFALTDDWRWFPYGELTPEEAAAAWLEIVNQTYLESLTPACPSSDMPTPYWDEDSDVDDELPADTQPWYGSVANPEASPDSLTFIENAAIWITTGFLAIATWEVGAAPAILFHTIAPKFVLAMRRGDAGEIIRILIDGQDAARVDTTSASVGDVINVPLIADPAITGGHDIMIVQVS